MSTNTTTQLLCRVLARTAHYALSLLQVLVALCRKHPALFEAEPPSCGEFQKYKINSGHLFKHNIFHVYECNCPDIPVWHNIGTLSWFHTGFFAGEVHVGGDFPYTKVITAHLHPTTKNNTVKSSGGGGGRDSHLPYEALTSSVCKTFTSSSS